MLRLAPFQSFFAGVSIESISNANPPNKTRLVQVNWLPLDPLFDLETIILSCVWPMKKNKQRSIFLLLRAVG